MRHFHPALTFLILAILSLPAQAQYELGETYRFALSSGIVKIARVIAHDSTALVVITHDDSDPEFLPYASVTDAEPIARRRNLLTLSAAGLYIGMIAPTYYRLVDDAWMIGGGPRYYAYNDGVGALFEARYHTAANAPYGFYIAPNAGYIEDFLYPFRDMNANDVVTVGFIAGWQWFASYHFGIGLGLSLDAVVPLTSTAAGGNDFEYPPFISYRLDVGWAW